MKSLHVRDLKNRDEMADLGLHQVVLDKIKKFNLNKKSSILILGAGKGNLDKLLIREGFFNITSVDINKKDYKVKGTTFYKFDLNEDFTFDSKKYDLILAIEIIEHIESTAHFIREIRRKLKNRGIAIITTPNVLEKVSRLIFCLFGYFTSFNEKSMIGWGHINPIFPYILKHYFKINRLKLIEEGYNRKYFDFVVIYSWKSYFYYVMLWILSNLIKILSLNKKNIEGVINIYIVKKD